ncbi:Ankyrin-3 [Dactylella cylindrospora]|nr:Ankyrin-3 [Dactylella cylindrospora]
MEFKMSQSKTTVSQLGALITPSSGPEASIEALIPLIDPGPNGHPKCDKPFSDSIYPEISRRLELAGKYDWSLRPRTYTLLHLINRLDSMDAFTSEGLFDVSLPYNERTLPAGLKASSAGAKFLELQPLVLSELASDFEHSDGRHRHFGIDGDNYFIHIGHLGKGAFGEVDHVRSRLSRNEFARKKILRGRTFSKDRDAVRRFEKELEVLKRLSHRHLVKFAGSYTDPKYVCLMMSPVAECNLTQYLNTYPFPAELKVEMRKFFGCLNAGLLYLHENQIRHKDLKPKNILIHNQSILITDFGTSLDWKDKGNSTTYQMPKAVTLKYSAPEVLQWQPRNSSSDIYSLGLVYLEMITVMRGESVDNMEKFFQDSTGQENALVQNNPAVLDFWIQNLRNQPGPASYDIPLDWIKEMLHTDPGSRPTAFQLMETISEAGGEYIGSCCMNTDDGTASEVSSYHGSAIGEEFEFSTEIEAAKLMISRGFDLHGWSFDLDYALQWAAGDGQMAIVRFLLRKGASTTAAARDGWTALHNAANKGHVDVARALIDAGANVHADADGAGTPLLWAAKSGSVAVVSLLLKKGASVSAKSERGWTALHWAAKCGHEDVAKLLISKGADVATEDKYGLTPLHIAAREGHAMVVKFLVGIGANPAAEDRNGCTVLQYASEAPVDAVMKILQDHRNKTAGDRGVLEAKLQKILA